MIPPICYMILLVALMFPVHVLTYENGRVEAACTTMEPQHGTTAQTSAAPYTITVDKPIYKSGDKVTVTISSPTGEISFKGFLLQARAASEKDTPLGSFEVSPGNTQTLKCTTSASAVSHTSGATKRNVQVTWIAPKANISNIQMRATIVENKMTYWTNVLGPKMTYNGTGSSDGPIIKASAFNLLYSCGALLLIILFRGF